MRKQQGVALLLVMLVLIVGALTPLLLKMLEIATAKAQLPGQTVERMKVVDQAIAAFVSANRRLPCPAYGTRLSGTLSVGTEVRLNGDCTAQITGVVPWVTLGLSEADVTDSWGGRFTFRVPTGANGLTRDGAMDATFCAPSGMLSLAPAVGTMPVSCWNTCVSPDPNVCSSAAAFLMNRGLWVKDDTGNAICDPSAIVPTGAAYVIISHGSEGGGAYDTRGVLTTSAVPPGAGESQNLNNQDIPVLGYFHSLAVADGSSAGTSHFDDVLSHPTIANLLVKTGLGARNH